ncbi:hypothetical protein HG530_015689 [Fusarium avenaceum]|nr:hypothetical protein HG530_015689 [Fusarium avenaceum]
MVSFQFSKSAFCLGKVAQHEGSGDALLDSGIGIAEEMKGIISLRTLSSGEIGQEVITITLSTLKEAGDTLLLVVVLVEAKVLHNLATRVLANKRLHHFPISLFLISFGVFDPLGTYFSDVASSNVFLELLGGRRNIGIDREVGNGDLRRTLLSRLSSVWPKNNNLTAKAEGSTHRPLEPVGSLGQRPRGVLGLILSSTEEILIIEVLLSRSLGGVRIGVLKGLHRDLSVEAGSR